MKSEFLFDEERHRYTLDGEELPGVTGIIDAAFDTYSCVPHDLMERARRYGTAVHKMAELYLNMDLDEDDIDEGLKGPLAALKGWIADYPRIVDGIRKIERPGYHSRLKYAGTPDLDGEAMVDIKSRIANMLTDPLQLAAYDHMTGKGDRKRYVLELRQDGRYVFTLANPTKAASTLHWQRFRYLLDYHKMTQEISRWK